MPELVLVVPTKGRRIRTPSGAVVPAQGLAVEIALHPIYWASKEADGDVFFAPVPPPIEESAPVLQLEPEAPSAPAGEE